MKKLITADDITAIVSVTDPQYAQTAPVPHM